MREIKFRAWNKKLGKWTNDFSWLDEHNPPIGTLSPYGDDVELMQFAGLKDKNGKEIYEGDIVQQYGRYGKRYKVYWRQERAGWYPFVHDRKDSKVYEIIGNIYENPEFIERSKEK